MSSFYGNVGIGSGSGTTTADIIFVDTEEDLPEKGETDILYVTKTDGIFIYTGNSYVNTASASIDLEWIDY